MCLTTQDSFTILDSKMRLHSLQGLAFARGFSAYKYNQPKYEIISQKYEKMEKIRDLDINRIECPKLKI